MRVFTAAAGAALLVLIASPALAGERGGRGGGHHPQPPQPARPAPCCQHGGGNTNVNINVNAQASAQAHASAGSYFNARAYDVGSIRGHGGYGGVIYTGGGYGGDAGGYVGGGAIYDEAALDGPACPSAPFGYVVTGFGRDERRPSRCSYRIRDDGYDRGGRYGYSSRRQSYEESRYEYRERYEEYGASAYYEDRGGYAHDGYDRDYRHDEGRGRDRNYDRDCSCRRDRDPAPYPAPHVEPYRPAPEGLGYYGDLPPPGNIPPQAPPRGGYPYRQEAGERG